MCLVILWLEGEDVFVFCFVFGLIVVIFVVLVSDVLVFVVLICLGLVFLVLVLVVWIFEVLVFGVLVCGFGVLVVLGVGCFDLVLFWLIGLSLNFIFIFFLGVLVVGFCVDGVWFVWFDGWFWFLRVFVGWIVFGGVDWMDDFCKDGWGWVVFVGWGVECWVVGELLFLGWGLFGIFVGGIFGVDFVVVVGFLVLFVVVLFVVKVCCGVWVFFWFFFDWFVWVGIIFFGFFLCFDFLEWILFFLLVVFVDLVLCVVVFVVFLVLCLSVVFCCWYLMYLLKFLDGLIFFNLLRGLGFGEGVFVGVLFLVDWVGLFVDLEVVVFCGFFFVMIVFVVFFWFYVFCGLLS